MGCPIPEFVTGVPPQAMLHEAVHHCRSRFQAEGVASVVLRAVRMFHQVRNAVPGFCLVTDSTMREVRSSCRVIMGNRE
jgi:hypothetical protein